MPVLHFGGKKKKTSEIEQHIELLEDRVCSLFPVSAALGS